MRSRARAKRRPRNQSIAWHSRRTEFDRQIIVEFKKGNLVDAETHVRRALSENPRSKIRSIICDYYARNVDNCDKLEIETFVKWYKLSFNENVIDLSNAREELTQYFCRKAERISGEEALWYINILLEFNPKHNSSLARGASLYAKFKMFNRTIDCLNGMDGIDFFDRPELVRLGFRFLRDKMFSESRLVFSKVVELYDSPDFPELYGLGYTLEKQKKKKKAMEMYHAAVQDPYRAHIFKDFRNEFPSTIFEAMLDEHETELYMEKYRRKYGI